MFDRPASTTDISEPPVASPSESGAEKSFGDILFERLDAAIGRHGLKRIRRFACSKKVCKWIIASDYCIGERTRPNDSFAFTIYAADSLYECTLSDLRAMTQRDLKEVGRIPSSIIRGLRGGKYLSIVLVVDRDRKLFLDINGAREALDAGLETMAGWNATAGVQEALTSVRGLRREFERKSASLSLLTNIILASSLAAYLAALLCEAGNVEAVMWAPDRDAISSAYRGVAHTFYNLALSGRCAEKGVGLPPTVGVMTSDSPLLDTFIRLPDYVAGAAAAYDPPDHQFVAPKLVQLLRDGFAENKYLFFLRVAFKAEVGGIRCHSSRLEMKRMTPRHRHERAKSSRASLRGSSKRLADFVARTGSPKKD